MHLVKCSLLCIFPNHGCCLISECLPERSLQFWLAVLCSLTSLCSSHAIFYKIPVHIYFTTLKCLVVFLFYWHTCINTYMYIHTFTYSFSCHEHSFLLNANAFWVILVENIFCFELPFTASIDEQKFLYLLNTCIIFFFSTIYKSCSRNPPHPRS